MHINKSVFFLLSFYLFNIENKQYLSEFHHFFLSFSCISNGNKFFFLYKCISLFSFTLLIFLLVFNHCNYDIWPLNDVWRYSLIWVVMDVQILSCGCNAFDYRFFDDSHTMTLHMMTLHLTSLLLKILRK